MTSPSGLGPQIDGRVAIVLAGLVGAIAFGAGITWSAGAPRPAADDEVRSADLDEILVALGQLRRTIEERSAADELAPVRVAASREGSSSRIDELATRLDELLSRHDAMGANVGAARAGATGQRGWRQVEREIEALRRPADLPELQRFVERHGQAMDAGKLPLEVSLLGVRQVIDRFGWPDSIEVSSDTNGPFTLTYRLDDAPDGGGATLVAYCTQFRTSYVGVED